MDKLCKVCNTIIICKDSWTLAQRVTCSIPCQRVWHSVKLKGRPLSSKHRVALRRRINHICPTCYVEFETTKLSTKRFCSTKCANSFRKSSGLAKKASQLANSSKLKNGTLVKGKDNYNWQGGIYPIKLMIYESQAMVDWRTSIFKRDKYTCVLCQTHNELRAHHIYYLSKLLQDAYKTHTQEYVRQNFSTMTDLWQIENGITLCNSCHRKVHIDPTLLENTTTKQWKGKNDTTVVILG